MRSRTASSRSCMPSMVAMFAKICNVFYSRKGIGLHQDFTPCIRLIVRYVEVKTDLRGPSIVCASEMRRTRRVKWSLSVFGEGSIDDWSKNDRFYVHACSNHGVHPYTRQKRHSTTILHYAQVYSSIVAFVVLHTLTRNYGSSVHVTCCVETS
jgi:hypothetical protein